MPIQPATLFAKNVIHIPYQAPKYPEIYMTFEPLKLQQSGLALLVDDVSTEQKGVLFAPALDISADSVNRIISLSTGILYVVLSAERSSALVLSSMSRPKTMVGNSLSQSFNLRMCVSVEAREGVTTGISASDRACTVRVLGEKIPNARKLVKPGHIFPMVARDGGVLVHHALPEGALDIVKMNGYTDAAAVVDMLDSDGSLYSVSQLREISEKENIPLFSLSELTQYRLQNEKLIERVAEAKLPTEEAGELRSIIYKSSVHEGEHVALVKGEINPDEPVLTRVQPECTFTDVFGGGHPPSRNQLRSALRAIGIRGSGVLVYMRRPVRGQLQQQVLQQGASYSASAVREYGLGSQILRDLNVKKIDLLTSSAHDYSGVRAFGLEIVSATPLFN